jgi:hypothetical protein
VRAFRWTTKTEHIQKDLHDFLRDCSRLRAQGMYRRKSRAIFWIFLFRPRFFDARPMRKPYTPTA